MVETGRKDLASLRVEDSLRDLSLVSFENGCAGKVGHVVDSHSGINAGCHQTGPDGVEVEVQDLICVSFEDGKTLACSYVPQATSLVDRGSPTHVASELKLCA